MKQGQNLNLDLPATKSPVQSKTGPATCPTEQHWCVDVEKQIFYLKWMLISHSVGRRPQWTNTSLTGMLQAMPSLRRSASPLERSREQHCYETGSSGCHDGCAEEVIQISVARRSEEIAGLCPLLSPMAAPLGAVRFSEMKLAETRHTCRDFR